MEYSYGYVAFVDILGFSKYVAEEKNGQIINNLFNFVRKFQYLFNTSPQLNAKVAFFSDSLVLTTTVEDGLPMLLLAIWIAESYLHKHTGLYFRGGIVKGLFYHEQDIAFGPAIVAAYKLEQQAKYSRILVDESIASNDDEPEFSILKDVDGLFYHNPYSVSILKQTRDNSQPSKSEMLASLKDERVLLCRAITTNINTPVSEKYLWRIIPFNKTCDLFSTICKEYDLEYTTMDDEEWKALRISIEEFTK